MGQETSFNNSNNNQNSRTILAPQNLPTSEQTNPSTQIPMTITTQPAAGFSHSAAGGTRLIKVNRQFQDVQHCSNSIRLV